MSGVTDTLAVPVTEIVGRSLFVAGTESSVVVVVSSDWAWTRSGDAEDPVIAMVPTRRRRGSGERRARAIPRRRLVGVAWLSSWWWLLSPSRRDPLARGYCSTRIVGHRSRRVRETGGVTDHRRTRRRPRPSYAPRRSSRCWPSSPGSSPTATAGVSSRSGTASGVIVFCDGEQIVLLSRNQRPFNRYFPELVERLTEALPPAGRRRRRDRASRRRGQRARLRCPAAAHPSRRVARAPARRRDTDVVRGVRSARRR